MLLISDRHTSELPSLFQAACARSVRFCGGIFPGLIDGAQRRDEGLIAIPLANQTRLTAASLTRDDVDWLTPPPTSPQYGADSALLFVDCQSLGITNFLAEIYDLYGTRVNYAGAGAGHHDLRLDPVIYTESGFIQHGGLLILIPGHSTVNVKHGWRRVAGPFIATRTKGNVIQELNWEPAGTFYRTQIGLLAPELKNSPIFPDLNTTFPLSIGKQAAEDVVRGPMEINEADEIVSLSDVPENSAIYISQGDKDSLLSAARHAVIECGGSTDVTACFISDCYSRALMLGDELATELRLVDEALKHFTDIPAQGVLALGEICGTGRSSLEFYNKTFVIAVTHGQH